MINKYRLSQYLHIPILQYLPAIDSKTKIGGLKLTAH